MFDEDFASNSLSCRRADLVGAPRSAAVLSETAAFITDSVTRRSEVKQRVDTNLVEPGHQLAIDNQGRCGSSAQFEQLVPGFIIDHDIFFGKFHPFAGQILCQCCTGASEGL